MYIENITLREIQPCTAAGNKIKIKAVLSNSSLEIMPYLNAVLPSAIYNKEAGWISFRSGLKIVTIFERDMMVTKLLNETDAYETLDNLKDMINETYENKDNIEPNDKMKRRATPIDFFKQLPRKNCKACGESTCMAFAGKLISGEADLERCTLLFTDEYEKERMELEGMMELNGISI